MAATSSDILKKKTAGICRLLFSQTYNNDKKAKINPNKQLIKAARTAQLL